MVNPTLLRKFHKKFLKSIYLQNAQRDSNGESLKSLLSRYPEFTEPLMETIPPRHLTGGHEGSFTYILLHRDCFGES